MDSKRVLVCGGRDFSDHDLMAATLGEIHAAGGISAIIHGAAPGADSLAGVWADVFGVPVESYPADWRSHGRAAGPIRNGMMLRDGKPDLVVAFPGGRGTADMVRRATAAGVPVLKVAPVP